MLEKAHRQVDVAAARLHLWAMAHGPTPTHLFPMVDQCPYGGGGDGRTLCILQHALCRVQQQQQGARVCW